MPPIDLPALKLIFIGVALSLNGRRPKTHDQSLSFKTPEKWIHHPSIKREYSGMVFDRKTKLGDGSDLVGVGHPLVTRALQQAESFTGAIAFARDLDRPVLVLQISDQLTDGGTHVQEVLVGMATQGDGYELLRDWQLLLMLNELNTTDCVSRLPNSSMAIDWIQKAKESLVPHLPALDLPFAVPDIRELVLLWPREIA